ncbi:tetratricopeptide repeat protein [Pelomonas sp. P7]|uniref:Tetratricopeptide repeat protein n=1 Tax=Pelomonas caseinilytica TaxID=2906763 RepID=A0ABS8XE24_9BURK|nr:tetratricopeptide repeat protein [Pelomonas sp. P7]MCE4539164.1 tetratricopeptide repeat protein [Pelomonas sp. P7]
MPEPGAAALLDQALRALAAGQPQAAGPLLGEVLRRDPHSPRAHAALGQIAAQQQRWAEAEAAFGRSLQGDAGQPRVWFARAQVLEMLQRPGDAAHAFAQAADRHAGWAAPRYHLARLLRDLGQRAAALQVASETAGLAPEDVDVLQLQAMLQEECGDLDAAEQTLGAALGLEPRRASLHHNLGVVLHRRGRHAQALAAHEAALALGLDAADAHYNLGNTLQALGRGEAAVAAYRQALARAPLHALGLYDLARLRWALGHAGFDAELLHAQQQAPASDLPPSLLGLLYLKAGRTEAALQAYGDAARLAPRAAAHADGLGQALCRMGRHAEAREAHRRAVEQAPEDVRLLTSAAQSLYAGGHDGEALALAERALALAPHDQLAIALAGLGWRLRGDPRDAWLHDPDTVIGMVDLAPPEGFADIESFNAALAQELAGLHTDAVAPIDQTLREGTQTRGHLFDLDLPLVSALRGRIEDAIGAWLATRPEDPTHPLFGRRTGAWRFADSWSSRLRRGGFHTRHIHGHGWLSSCYYVAAPPSALASSTHAGWIQFGEPALPEPAREAFPPWRFEAPRPGRLLLFPSYLWHGTLPFEDDAFRLTVAFDVVPA